MRPVIITCAVTGASTGALKKHPAMPITPEEIANAAVSAGEAGAAIVHIRVQRTRGESIHE